MPAQTTISIKDGNGASQTVNTNLLVGTAGTPSADVVSVQGVTGGTPQTLRTNIVTVTATEFTRPANTTAYTAWDVVGTSPAANISFPSCFRVNEGTGYVVKARVACDNSASPAQFRLYLFNTAPTAIADNDPFTLLYANFTNRVGFIDFPALSTQGAGSTEAQALWTGAPLAVQAASGSSSLTGVLVARTGFTPASGTKFRVQITIDQN